MLDTCLVPDCCQLRHNHFDGKPYCTKHYQEKFMSTLMSTYEGWQINAAPSQRLKYLVGRFQSEFCSCSGGSYLSSARVRDRGFDFRKNETGGEFCITRHLNAWSDTKRIELVVECWSFNLEKREFELVSTRKWTTNDPE
jgi:hypothetical protein